MSNKVGKATENRVSWGRWIVSSIDAHKSRLTSKLDGRMGLADDEWEKWLVGQRDELSNKTDALFDAALALARERADDPQHREERDELADKLIEVLTQSRSLLESVRQGQARRFGLDGRMPRTPQSLEAFARNVTENLRANQTTFTTLGVTVSTQSLADKVEEHYKDLKDKIVELKSEERKAEGLLVQRNEVLDHWTRVYQAVAHMIEGAYRLVGEDELADRIRPTIAKVRGAQGPDDEQVFDENDEAELRDEIEERDAPSAEPRLEDEKEVVEV